MNTEAGNSGQHPSSNLYAKGQIAFAGHKRDRLSAGNAAHLRQPSGVGKMAPSAQVQNPLQQNKSHHSRK